MLWLCPLFLAAVACEVTAEQRPRKLTVFAASSLTEAARDLEGRFEAKNEDVDVVIALAGSQILRLQVEQGAPADVFVSADASHMEALVRRGFVGANETLAHNELVLIVPLSNPAGIEAFEDLPRARRVVIGVPNVPIGNYTRQALSKADVRFGGDFQARVLERVVSEESNVRLVRAKVELGEADAAIVYRTDATESTGVRVVPIPDEVNVLAEYRAGVVADSPQKRLARAWIDYMTSDSGRQALAEHGFVTDR